MRLPKYILIVLPIAELILFIEVGALMGSLSVILSIIITMFLGYYLIKQKLKNISLGMFNVNNIKDIYTEYTTSMYSIIGGLLLIVPGYITDFIGLIVLLPYFRPKISHYFDLQKNQKRSNHKKNNIIDGDYRNDE
tara:strand:- start:83 stop:490 length:408 start_codon:yes stop_codon:yes gene_type:complete